MVLLISVLGPIQVTRDNEAAVFATDRAQALLAYLSVEADRPHRREALAGLLWPDIPEALARRNLSQALVRLRRAIDDYHTFPPFLQITRKTILFHANRAELDVSRFQALLAACDVHPHPSLPACPPCIERLEQAAGLYRGEFLQGLFLDGSQPFEEWALFRREQFHRQTVDALHTLTVHYEARGSYATAQRYAERQLNLEPWREEAHRQLMRVLALGGQRTAALAQFESCCRVLADELGLDPAAETVAMYEQIRAGTLSRGDAAWADGPDTSVDFPPAHPPAPAHNLPAQLTPFVDRAKELAALARLLAKPEARLLTVHGPGGIGKTRLAIEAAKNHAGAAAHGVWYIPLAPVDPDAQVDPIHRLLSTLGDALHLTFTGDETPRDQVLAFLQARETLLVFDSYEPLPETSDLVLDLLAHAPGTKILVASRQRLNLWNEWLFPLQGLQVPPDGVAAADVGDFGAIQLFWHRARQVQPRFDPAAELPWVVRICRLVEGMPLGIELAAAWVRLMPCRAIAQEIEKSLDFLTTSVRDVPVRHRSLRAVFDQSWALLPEKERAVFQKLAVFRGGFRRKAAEAVAGATLWQLSDLVDRSLLQVTAAGRYETHRLLGQYAEEKLRQTPGKYEETRERHGKFYTAMLQARESWLEGGNQPAALAEIGTEIENVRAAWNWAIEQGQIAAIEQGLGSLFHYYDRRSWFEEGEAAFGRAALSLEAEGQEPAGAGRGRNPRVEIVQGKLRARQGWFAFQLGRHRQAKELLQASLAHWQQKNGPAGTREPPVFSLNYLGAVHCHLREYQQADRYLQESVDICREAGNQFDLSIALNVLGQVAYRQEDYPEAKRLWRESMALKRELDDRWGLAFSLDHLGQAAYASGEHEEAESCFRQSLTIRREIDDRRGIALCLNHLGDVARERAEPTEARALYQDSLAGFKEIGNQWGIISTVLKLGNLDCASGEVEARTGQDHFAEALMLAAAIRAWPLALEALAEMAHCLARGGQPEQAIELLTLSLNHPAGTREMKDRAARLQTELAAKLPSESAAAARARGQARKLEEIVAELYSRTATLAQS